MIVHIILSSLHLTKEKNVIKVPENAKYYIISGLKEEFKKTKIVNNLRLNVNELQKVANVKQNKKLLIPSIVRCCPKVQNNYYYQNIARGFDPNVTIPKTDTIYQGVQVRKTRYLVNITDELISNGIKNVDGKISFEFENQTEIEKDITFQMVNTNSGQGMSKKCVIIGDSLTATAYYPYYLKELFKDDVMTVDFLGTIKNTSFNVNTEGRSSWRMYDYTETSERTTGAGYHGINPFWNTETNKLDFNNYVATKIGGVVHYVLLCLGTNDLTQGNHDTKEEVKSYWDKMITSIHSYNNRVKIAIWLPPTRALCDNSSRESIERANTINEWLLEWYDNREKENIFIMPSGLNVDSYYDYNMTQENVSDRNSDYKTLVTTDNVHPSTNGYHKLADVAYTYLKYFGKLDNQ